MDFCCWWFFFFHPILVVIGVEEYSEYCCRIALEYRGIKHFGEELEEDKSRAAIALLLLLIRKFMDIRERDSLEVFHRRCRAGQAEGGSEGFIIRGQAVGGSEGFMRREGFFVQQVCVILTSLTENIYVEKMYIHTELAILKEIFNSL